MMRFFLNIIVCCFIVSSCATSTNRPKDVKNIADISTINAGEHVTKENANKILRRYTINFIIPNPLYGDTGNRPQGMNPKHEETIYCKAILLEDLSTEADIFVQCRKDSLDEKSCEDFRKNYFEQHVRDGMFRIQISMESGFSDKSMEPGLWDMYIENVRGVMIEPIDIEKSKISALQDTVFSSFERINLPRNVLHRDITLYFKRITFFGEDLFGKENPFIVFVISRKQKIVSRVAWNISGERE